MGQSRFVAALPPPLRLYTRSRYKGCPVIDREIRDKLPFYRYPTTDAKQNRHSHGRMRPQRWSRTFTHRRTWYGFARARPSSSYRLRRTISRDGMPLDTSNFVRDGTCKPVATNEQHLLRVLKCKDNETYSLTSLTSNVKFAKPTQQKKLSFEAEEWRNVEETRVGKEGKRLAARKEEEEKLDLEEHWKRKELQRASEEAGCRHQEVCKNAALKLKEVRHAGQWMPSHPYNTDLNTKQGKPIDMLSTRPIYYGSLVPTLARQAECRISNVPPQHTGFEIVAQSCGAQDQDQDRGILQFHIPDDIMRKALLAPRNTADAYWSHSLYRGPSGERVVVHYCRSLQTGERVAQMFLNQPILGFDIEWKPQAKTNSGVKNNVSLVQLACEQRIALFQLALHKGETVEEILPPSLRLILESKDTIKAGVAVKADFTRLTKNLGITPAGLIELSHLHNLVTHSAGDPAKVSKKLVGLTHQVREHLHLPLSKGEVRTSDWSRELNHEQCFYAAADAYAGFRIYHALEAKRLALKPTPNRPEFAELNLPIKRATPVSEESATHESETSSVDEELADEDVELLLPARTSNGNPPDRSKAESSTAANDDLSDDVVEKLELAAKANEIEDFTAEELPGSSVIATDKSTLEVFVDGTLPADGNFVGRVHLGDEISQPGAPGHTSDKTRTESEMQRMLKLADEWARQHIASSKESASRIIQSPWAPKSKANISSLRAFFLWEHHKLDVDEISKLVRDPPLKVGTVATYVVECLQFEDVTCSDWRRAKVLLDQVPYLAQDRYKELRKNIAQRTGGSRV